MLQGEFGKYRIEQIIGMGGMSIVYRAFDRELLREVALKIINLRYANNPQEVRRFQREMEVAKRLRHPNIIDIYEYGEVDGFAYLAMEYMPGGSLADRYADPSYVTLSEAVFALNVIASALDFAHSEGVLHRDLKLSNVLVAADGRLTLSDFGLALIQDESRITGTGQTFGTPIYMSPEQVSGQSDIDYRSDVYSFAVIAYWLATGAFPFFAQNSITVMHQHLNEAPAPPTTINPQLPRALDEVLLKGLAKQPEDRYESAGALAQAFAEVVTPVATTQVILVNAQPLDPNATGAMPSVPSGTEEAWWSAVIPTLNEDNPPGYAPPNVPAYGHKDEAGFAGDTAVRFGGRIRDNRRRWAVGIVGVAAVLVILLLLSGTVFPDPLPRQIVFDDATDVAPSATVTLNAEASLTKAAALATEEAETATATATRTPRPSATREPSVTATATNTRTVTGTATRTRTATRPPTLTRTRANPTMTAARTQPPTSVPAQPSSVPPTSVPPTQAPPTSLPPTAVPPTSIPPTAVPPTSIPPTPVPPTSVPPTEAPPTAGLPPILPTIVPPVVYTLLPPGLGDLLGG